MEPKDMLALLAVAISLFSIYMSWRNSFSQGELTAALKDKDLALDRKKLVISMWDKIANMWEVSPSASGQYNEDQVFENLNVLELLAMCWVNEIADRELMFLACGESFSLRVKEISSIASSLPNLRRTGPELLQERPVILKVAAEIDGHIAGGTKP